MKKVVISLIFLIIGMLFLPMITAETPVNDSGPELESYIRNGFRIFTFQILVKNTGDETAHNVTITNATADGNIFFNFQESKLPGENLEPGKNTELGTNSMVLGFGNFSISITVSCDEGASSTSSVIGLIFGPFMIIP
jgi:hypothetical protein